MSTPIQQVAANALKQFAPVLHPQSVRIFTPFTAPVALDSCKLNADLKKFLVDYEPKLKQNGLFPHQAEFLKKNTSGGADNYIITTATGSGKSLCFWSWVFDRLSKDRTSTAILCFPTQALMWGQAERLTRLSNPKKLVKPDSETVYGGTVKFGKQNIGWSVWLGEFQDKAMAAHATSDEFKSARIRIATLDKAHYSLLKREEDKNFAQRLTSFVLDEAHTYHGVFGANVHYFLKRLFLSKEIFGQSRPAFFLASATLNSARTFATTLLSLDSEKEIVHIEDSTKQEIALIPTADVPKQLSNPPSNGLLRMVMLLNAANTEASEPKKSASLVQFMGSDKHVGAEINSIYFTESKLHGKRMKHSLDSKPGKRAYIIYDADLPPRRRREVERELNDPSLCGTTVLATSALELGVDIEGLDACFIDQIPPSRADLLQRIGRVGRRAERPGLVILSLSAEPHDQQILDNQEQAFRLDLNRSLVAV
ncbi:MAG: DEAD/DEAH box helicase [Planctomycetaceae bacterium]